MTKNEVLKAVQGKLEINVPQKDIATILDAFEAVITETLVADHNESVAIGKLGKFKIKDVPARSGVSAINGKPWHTDAHAEITFKMSRTAKNI